MLLERSVIRLLYGRPLETLLATWGISLVLQQLVRLIFGAHLQPEGRPMDDNGNGPDHEEAEQNDIEAVIGEDKPSADLEPTGHPCGICDRLD